MDGAAHGADNAGDVRRRLGQGDTALIAGATAAGGGVLLRVDLADPAGHAPVARVIARSSAPGHLFADPSAVGSAAYWADVWYDRANGLHSAVWRDDDAGQQAERSRG